MKEGDDDDEEEEEDEETEEEPIYRQCQTNRQAVSESS